MHVGMQGWLQLETSIVQLVTSWGNAVNEHIIKDRWFSSAREGKVQVVHSSLLLDLIEWSERVGREIERAAKILQLVYSNWCLASLSCVRVCAIVCAWVLCVGIYVSVLSIRIQIVVVFVSLHNGSVLCFQFTNAPGTRHKASGIRHQAKSQRLTSCLCSLRDEDVFQAIKPQPSTAHFKIPCRYICTIWMRLVFGDLHKAKQLGSKAIVENYR